MNLVLRKQLTTQEEKQLLKRMWKPAQNSQNLISKVLRTYVFTIVKKIMFQNSCLRKGNGWSRLVSGSVEKQSLNC